MFIVSYIGLPQILNSTVGRGVGGGKQGTTVVQGREKGLSVGEYLCVRRERGENLCHDSWKAVCSVIFWLSPFVR